MTSYGRPPTSARPYTRPGDTEAHLVEAGDPYALCGRPAGRRGHHWKAAEATPHLRRKGEKLPPGTITRCTDCDLAMRSSNPRPSEPRYWWRV